MTPWQRRVGGALYAVRRWINLILLVLFIGTSAATGYVAREIGYLGAAIVAVVGCLLVSIFSYCQGLEKGTEIGRRVWGPGEELWKRMRGR